ncbi:MAG: nickel pincer cofactor biosynthesis protein LarC [Candidatus Heimdallarchaeota archaeon]|nr:nickel pincer cofactor biosynthesis protein LarC [Candidatus Heimdallarchaeota archaeon]
MIKALVIDPRNAGCSGDMFLSVLIDLFDDIETLDELVEIMKKSLKVDFSLERIPVIKKGIKSTSIQIDIKKDIEQKHATEIQDLFKAVLKELKLSEKAQNTALKMLTTLFEAESLVHGEKIEKLHLHETASLDTILDIIGTVLLLEKHEFLDVPIYGLPANVGSGFVTFSHGKMAIPPPAVVEILKASDYMFFSDDAKGELLTPTGAIILTVLTSNKINKIPPIKIKGIGYGAGQKDLPNRSNVLRILSVEIDEKQEVHYLSMLETHIDDVSGELLGGIVNKLLEQGALDVSYYPLIMKKNRPAYSLRVICEEDQASDLAFMIMKELGTLGVRESRFGRYELERKIVKKKFFIEGDIYECKYKERFLNDEIIGVKPEYEDVVSISEKTGIPLIELEVKLINFYHLEDEYCE